ncbi:hypothetical protein [Mesorhizobium huakuii]|uniref:hypothetical protein n=1 Tax=Mesorhizobium huakuii TaxID=28104 RepID=UPI0024E0A3CA|nr:hypothetical protein [Mesorhizobium huakuii]
MFSNPAIRQYTETLQIANRAALAGEFGGRHRVANFLENPARNAALAMFFVTFMDHFIFCTAIAHIAAHNDKVG